MSSRPEQSVPHRILICENERQIGEDIAGSLRSLGHEVPDIVLSGEEAVHTAAELRPDLILMDIKLQGEINGIEAVEKIHAFLDVPVVYLTGYAEKDLLEGAKRTEPYGYLSKPIGMMELRGKVELALYKHSADKRVRESETQYRAILKTSQDGFCLLDTQGRILEVNDAYSRMSGYSGRELVGMTVHDLDVKETSEEVTAHIKKVMAEGSDLFETVIRRKDGSLMLTEVSVQFLPGEPGRIFTFNRDITGRKKAEEALKESGRRHRELVETVSDGIVQTDCLGTIAFANPAYCRMLGFTMEEMVGKSILDFQTPDSKREEMRAYLKDVCREKPSPAPWFGDHRTRDGGLIFVQADWNYRLDHHGHVIGFISVVKDITEQKKAEEERDRILKLSHDLICVAGMDGYFKYVNPSWERALDYTREELLSRPFLDFIHPQDHEKNAEEVRKLADGQTIVDFENRYVHKDGSIRAIQWTAVPLMEEGLMYCVGRDITDRKKAEESLRESESTFRAVYESSMLGIGFWGPDGEVYDANDAYLEMIGHTRDDLINKTINWKEITPEEHLPSDLRAIEQITASGRCAPYEKEYLRPDGSRVTAILGGVKPLGWNQGIAFALDVTDRKKAEDLAKSTLAEKEVLLREIHHRVKNNLAVISSMLRLQSRRSANDLLIEAFDEASDRIRSMALAHELLYRSENLAEIDVNKYMANLVDHLVTSVNMVGTRISVTKAIEAVSYNIDTAIPVGFILTELLSNCMKHAFPDGRAGHIDITLSQFLGGNYELIVADNGVGMPQGIDLESLKSLGLELVEIFVKELRGEVEVSSQKGTRVRIEFKEINKG